MKIAISGLGRMGSQIARKLAEDGHEVIAHNRSPEPIDEAAKHGAKGAYSNEEVLAAFSGQPVILWLMLPESITDEHMNFWLAKIPQGSVLIDGGNSNFKRTQERAKKVEAKESYLVDVGTSGGVWGYKNGFSLMAGGDEAAYKLIEPALKTLAKPAGAYQHFGPTGSGHFVKMVHNAIEYGMMESLAEGYRLLHDGPIKNLNLAAAGEVWQHGSVIVSWLNELARDALSESPRLDRIDGVVAESGEARWTLDLAREIGLPMPAIQAAFDVRLASQDGDINFATKLLAAMRNKFGGHALNPTDPHASERQR
ncbi:MAG TPA: decarboxylating 6-phosphogluconate dehydrogenase [Candidatus Saccharimonadales bacterium]|nr:decarboxylating 6-phosphogluconate dehydrogenase [Candidatus Saccharimonadales bacterium]